jgi:hypothetical protein
MKKCKNKKKPPKFYVSTYNLRTLSSDARFLKFENAVFKIKYDVIGLSEVKQIGQETKQKAMETSFITLETQEREAQLDFTTKENGNKMSKFSTLKKMRKWQ